MHLCPPPLTRTLLLTHIPQAQVDESELSPSELLAARLPHFGDMLARLMGTGSFRVGGEGAGKGSSELGPAHKALPQLLGVQGHLQEQEHDQQQQQQQGPRGVVWELAHVTCATLGSWRQLQGRAEKCGHGHAWGQAALGGDRGERVDRLRGLGAALSVNLRSFISRVSPFLALPQEACSLVEALVAVAQLLPLEQQRAASDACLAALGQVGCGGWGIRGPCNEGASAGSQAAMLRCSGCGGACSPAAPIPNPTQPPVGWAGRPGGRGCSRSPGAKSDSYLLLGVAACDLGPPASIRALPSSKPLTDITVQTSPTSAAQAEPQVTHRGLVRALVGAYVSLRGESAGGKGDNRSNWCGVVPQALSRDV